MSSIDFIDEAGREWAHASRYRALEDENAALRKRVEELEISAGSASMTIRLAQERAEKAERERDELMEAHQALGREYEMQGRKLDKLQADLDAALVLCVASDWDVEVLGAGYEPEVYKAHAHVLPLLEKRREGRG